MKNPIKQQSAGRRNVYHAAIPIAEGVVALLVVGGDMSGVAHVARAIALLTLVLSGYRILRGRAKVEDAVAGEWIGNVHLGTTSLLVSAWVTSEPIAWMGAIFAQLVALEMLRADLAAGREHAQAGEKNMPKPQPT